MASRKRTVRSARASSPEHEVAPSIFGLGSLADPDDEQKRTRLWNGGEAAGVRAAFAWSGAVSDWPLFCWLSDAAKAEAANALGGTAKLEKAFGRLHERAGIHISQADSVYRWADRLDEAEPSASGRNGAGAAGPPSRHSHLRKEEAQRLAGAVDALHRLDNLQLPRAVLAPLESFLTDARMRHHLTHGYRGGRPRDMRGRVRGHFKQCGLTGREIARVELGGVLIPPTPEWKPDSATFNALVQKIRGCPTEALWPPERRGANSA